MIAMSVSATTQAKAIIPPENDIGYCQTVAILSVDGQNVVMLTPEMNFVELQTPVVLSSEASETSAQVLYAYTIATRKAEVSMTLVSYRWPRHRQNILNTRNGNTSLPIATSLQYLSTARTDTA